MSDDGRPAPPDEDTESVADAELADVLDRYLADVTAGRAVDTQRLLAEHPAIASRLRVCLAGLGLVEQEGRALRSGSGGRPQPSTASPRELGDYRLLREVGRGGMGIVYEAEQVSLNRRVALKVLPFASTLDPRQLQRFQAEARAAASLQHAHIVPVYAVGYEQGVHFYAMQFIDGQSLASLLGDLRRRPGQPSAATESATQLLRSAAPALRTPPAPPNPTDVVSPARVRELVGLGVQAAEALEHAHQLGIVHRDVKPANLLLDSTGRLWVSDFGLALFRTDERLTQTGDVVGTLRYMSPEQARAQRGLVDHRTDVYALGATLYELLTLRPLFDGPDAQSLLVQVAFKDPIPPRRLNPAIPADLEVVLLKAVAKSPEERYATAQDFADDLRAVLEDRPVRAQPPSVRQRLARWGRRHRTFVASVLLGLVLAVVGLAVSTVMVWRALAEQTRTALELREALGREQHNASLYCVTAAAAAWEENRAGRVEELLGECAPQTRFWEWHYLKRQCHQDLLTLRGHADMIHGMDLSADGKLLATGSLDRSVRLWDAATGQTVRVLAGQPAPVYAVAFSPDAANLAVGDGTGGLRIYRVADGSLIAKLRGHKELTESVSWHPGGRHLASGSGTTVTVWDIDRNEVVRELSVGDGRVKGVAFSRGPGWPLLAASDWSGGLKVWDAATGQERLKHNYGALSDGVVFSPDGQRLALLSDTEVHVLAAAGGRQELLLRSPPSRRISALAFSPDGNSLVTGSYDRTVLLWDAKTGRVLRRYRGHADMVFRVAFSPDGRRIYSSSKDGTVKVWDALTEPSSRVLGEHEDRVVALAFSPDSRRLATATLSPVVRIWDATTGQLRTTLQGHKGDVLSVAFLPDGTPVTGGADGDVILWDEAAAQPLRRLTQDGEVAHLAVGDGGRLLAATTRRQVGKVTHSEVRVWDVGRGEIVARFAANPRPGYRNNSSFGAAFSPDGRLLARGEEGIAFPVHELATGRELFRCGGSRDYGGRIAFSPDGRLLAGPGNAMRFEVCVWNAGPDAGAGERPPMRVFRGHTQPIEDVAFSPDGRRLVSIGRDSAIRIWDLEKGWEVLMLRGDEWACRSVAFSPDGNLLAAGTGNKLARIWDGTPWE